MSLPMLQVALDNQTLSHAYETTRLIAEEVDIIEVGTILCVGEGVRAVRDLKALYPHKIVLADAKIADAGKILSRMCFEANADWVTVMAEGKIVAEGQPKSVMNDPAVIDAYLGAHANVDLGDDSVLEDLKEA